MRRNIVPAVKRVDNRIIAFFNMELKEKLFYIREIQAYCLNSTKIPQFSIRKKLLFQAKSRKNRDLAAETKPIRISQQEKKLLKKL